MCGIALLIEKTEENLKEKIENIIFETKHRGPDDNGFYFEKNLALGSNRLSIFDLTENGKMPFRDKSGRYYISYNGEIYNYLELKEKFNIKTNTKTDTEILIELFAKLKEKMLDHLNGIFSFIIYDSIEKEIFCARDRLGVKPLYYFHDNEKFIISSEIKGILKVEKNLIDLNFDAINTYLSTSFYNLDKNTFFNKIYQLDANHFMKFNLKDKIINFNKYWNIKNEKNSDKDEESLLKELNQLVINSFKLQTRTDTDLGINCSGGIDSKLMMLTLNKLNKGQKNVRAYSYYFENKNISEKEELEKFSKKIGWKINFTKITPEDIIKNFDEVFDCQDEPFPGIPTISKHLLIKKNYDKNFKVVLEAQGGDDVAAGYKYVFPFYIKSLINKSKFFKAFNEIIKFTSIEQMKLIQFSKFYKDCIKNLEIGNLSADGTSSFNKEIFKDPNLIDKNNIYKNILNELIIINNPLKKIIYRDLFHCKLPRILRSCDRASMAYGIELRVPLLDHNIVKFFYNLDEDFLIKNGNMRYLYRRYLEKFYPEIDQKIIFTKKKYVSDPQVFWLKDELFEWALDRISSKFLEKTNLYNQEKLIGYFKDFKTNKNLNNSNIFWQAICLEKLSRNIN